MNSLLGKDITISCLHTPSGHTKMRKKYKWNEYDNVCFGNSFIRVDNLTHHQIWKLARVIRTIFQVKQLQKIHVQEQILVRESCRGFDTNISLNFYLISSQQLSSHYKSSEGRTSRYGKPQKHILHNTKRGVISLNIVNLSASTFIATL